MPWNGSAPNKTFGRTDGTRTGSQTWREADAAGVDIVSDDHDTHDQDIADGLNQALLKDGGNTATANIPMGGFRFTNLGDATALTQAATGKQVLNSSFQYCSVGGTANTITLSTGFSATAYTAGMTVSWVVGSTNTGATTINVDSLGAKSLVRANGAHTALQPGDLSAGALVEAQYDGTRFQLRSPSASATSADVLARIVKVGSVVAWPHSTVPAGWLECYGQAVSRTTYAELYAAIGTTYGVGDGSTTFNLPDLRGRSIFGEDDMGGTSADRITSAVAGFDGDTLGATGGAQSYTLLRTDLPNVSPTITINDPGHNHTYVQPGGPNPSRAGGIGDTITNRTPTTTGSSTTNITATCESLNGGVTQTAFSKMPPAMVLKWIILANPAQASASTLGVHGLQYSWSTSTSGDPGAGHLLVDNSTLASATALNISETDGLAVSVADFLATWDDSTSTINGFIHITKVGDPGTFAIFSTSGSLTDNGGYDTFTVSHVASAGTLASGDPISILFYRTGDKGDQGIQGQSGVDGGIRFDFDDDDSMADPGSGNVRLNNADLSLVTAIAVSDLCAEEGNPDVSAFVLSWDDSDSTAHRGTLTIKNVDEPENFAIYSITGASTDDSGWTQLAVTYVTSAGAFTDADALSLVFSRTGNKGDAGSNGSNGSDGADGVDAGIRWAFDDSTTTNADPGSGDLRLNNASLASATEIAISYACGETGTPDVEDYVKSWDDSTTTGNRGTLILKKASAPENYAIYSITSAITDSTTYGRFTISHLSSDGSFTAADVLSVQFLRSGDKGSDGAGLGDVTAASNFGADNVLIKSDGTSKGVQATGITVDSSDNVSGVNNVTGVDTDFVTGTAGTDGNLVAWNTDGDAVDSGVATAAVLTSGDIGVSVQGYDADTLKGDVEDQGPLTGGASVTPKDLGNSGTSTIAVDVRDRATQLLSNTGNFTLEMAAHAGSTVLYITNSGTAGSVTTSYFTYVKGDAFTTTNGHIFRCTLEYVSSALKILWVERL